MATFEKQLKKLFKKLTANQDRADSKWLRKNRVLLENFMDENPASVTIKEAPEKSIGTMPGSFITRPVFATLITIMLLIIVGAGTVGASQSSLPGDIFYPVKIVTEKISLSLKSSNKSKAQLHLKYADKRLAEIESASSRDKTSEAALGKALEDMNKHMEQVSLYLSQKGATTPENRAEVALDYEVTAKTQTQRADIIETKLEKSFPATAEIIKNSAGTNHEKAVDALEMVNRELDTADNIPIKNEVSNRLESIKMKAGTVSTSTATDSLPETTRESIPLNPTDTEEPSTSEGTSGTTTDTIQ